MIAPAGAAAYAEAVTDRTAKVIFAMIQKGETGVQALERVLAEPRDLEWKAVAARPEEQRNAPVVNFPFASYDFTYVDGRWTAATEAIAAIINAMSNFQTLPKTPPSEIAFNFGPAKAKAVRSS